MNQLLPIIRRVRRPLLPADEPEGRVTRVPNSIPEPERPLPAEQGLAELVPPEDVSPALVKVEEAFAEAEKRKGRPSGKAAA